MKKKFFAEIPKLQCNELSTDEHEKIKNFYESKYEKSGFCRKVIDGVSTVDKTLLTLIAGSLTGLSVNLVTGFMDLQNMISSMELIFRVFQFIFTCGFNIYVIRFTAKVISIHEYGNKYIPDQKIPLERLEAARYNLMFYACMNQIKDLKRFLIMGSGCAVGMLLSLFFKDKCIIGLNGAAITLQNLISQMNENGGI